MEEFRTKIIRGTTIAELRSQAGEPLMIIHHGEALPEPKRAEGLPSFESNTAVYFYARDGIPYFCVYVFVDTLQGVVSSCTVKSLWW